MQVNRFRFIPIIISLLFAASSCVEEYWPELNSNSEHLLVIDGKISNFPGPYTVKLSKSSSINSPEELPLSQANVIIIDNLGNQEALNEINPGIYKTSLGGIQGVIGRSYKIKIHLSNGKLYESDFEELKEPVGVKNIDLEERWKLAGNALEVDEEGVQFYISSKESESSKAYFYWEIEETFEYHSKYNITFYYDGKFYEETFDNPYGLARPQFADTLRYCWKTQQLSKYYSYSTEYLSVPMVDKMPLHFIPYTDQRLKHKYSIQVKQFTISEEAFIFLDMLEKQNENQGALFTTQPYQIRGNVFNVEDDTEPVLGFFMVAGGSYSERLLTKAPSRIRYGEMYCTIDTTSYSIRNAINQASQTNIPFFFTTVYLSNPENPEAEEIEAFAIVNQECIDCTRKGGVAIKPEYWDW